jgi:hypothetical protein
MSDSARLAKQAHSGKPSGEPLSKFQISDIARHQIIDALPGDITDASYAAAVSFAEAIAGLRNGSAAWSIVRLYYSSFYSIKASLLMAGVVPFNGKSECIFDSLNNQFYKGGDSSHHWNWGTLGKITSLKSQWPFSIDSQNAYANLRQFREDVNYRHSFPDPNMHSCLHSNEADISKRLKAYRDDEDFFYTYLPDHLALSYPTKLAFLIDSNLNQSGQKLSKERSAHLSSIWPLKYRCPMT